MEDENSGEMKVEEGRMEGDENISGSEVLAGWNREDQNELISQTRGWTCRPPAFVHRHGSRLMRSGKTSNKNNLSCYDHELIPVRPSTDEPSKSFSSQRSVQPHPGHYCTDNTCTCQGGGINNRDAANENTPLPFPFALFFCPPSSSPSSGFLSRHVLGLSRSLLARRHTLVNLPKHRRPDFACHSSETKMWRFATLPFKYLNPANKQKVSFIKCILFYVIK